MAKKQKINAEDTELPMNARLVIKQKSEFVSLSQEMAENILLYGNVEEGTSDADGYDERNYKNSIYRHSNLFRRMRRIRANIESTGGIRQSEERYIPENDGESEKHSDGRYEYYDDRKLIYFSDGATLEVKNDGTAILLTDNILMPELVLRQGERISDNYYPQLDFFLKLGASIEMPQRNCYTCTLCDELTALGGSFYTEYVIEIGGVEVERTKLMVTVYPYQDIWEERGKENELK